MLQLFSSAVFILLITKIFELHFHIHKQLYFVVSGLKTIEYRNTVNYLELPCTSCRSNFVIILVNFPLPNTEKSSDTYPGTY
jgi:hypothetical protein